MNDKTEYRSASWEKDSEGRISGYAVVFSSRTEIFKDPETGISYYEEIAPDALNNANLDDVVLRVDHEGKVLARTRNKSLTLTIDSKGLKIDADLTGSEESRNVFEAVKNGLYDKMSFAFTVSEDSFDNATRTRTIRRIDRLFDVAVVTFPAYEETSVSARAKYEPYAVNDRKAYYQAENRKTLAAVESVIEKFDLTNRDYSPIDGIDLTEREQIYKQMVEIRNRCIDINRRGDSLIGAEPMAALESLENQLVELHKRETETRQAVARGFGKTTKTFDADRKDNKKMDISEIRTNFYNSLIEKRAAAGTSGMSNVIPVDILDHAFRTGNNGVLPFVSMTHIANGGSVKIPYLTDISTSVSAHTENAAITPGNVIPSVVTITHSELQQMLGYSYLGMSVAEADLRYIVEDALIGAMDVKLDSVALAAIDALTWVTTSGATQNAIAWTTSGAPTLYEILDLMKLLPAQYSSGAKFFMNKATILSVIQNSTGNTDSNNSNAMYNVSVLDGLARLFGTQVVEDSNLANGVIFYGKPEAVHLNIAGEIQLANWLDRDALTEKFQVACAAGAGCEVGAFVKGANSFS